MATKKRAPKCKVCGATKHKWPLKGARYTCLSCEFNRALDRGLDKVESIII